MMTDHNQPQDKEEEHRVTAGGGSGSGGHNLSSGRIAVIVAALGLMATAAKIVQQKSSSPTTTFVKGVNRRSLADFGYQPWHQENQLEVEFLKKKSKRSAQGLSGESFDALNIPEEASAVLEQVTLDASNILDGKGLSVQGDATICKDALIRGGVRSNGYGQEGIFVGLNKNINLARSSANLVLQDAHVKGGDLSGTTGNGGDGLASYGGTVSISGRQTKIIGGLARDAESEYFATAVRNYNGVVTIYDGIFGEKRLTKESLNSYGGDLTIHGGTFHGTLTITSVPWNQYKSYATITGGTYHSGWFVKNESTLTVYGKSLEMGEDGEDDYYNYYHLSGQLCSKDKVHVRVTVSKAADGPGPSAEAGVLIVQNVDDCNDYHISTPPTNDKCGKK